MHKVSWRIYFFAIRPSFLSITLLAAGLAFSLAKYYSLTIDYVNFALASLVALLFHASANVYNDIADENNGGDAINQQRIYPFTGGSRFIQDGILSVQQTKNLAQILLFFTCLIGMILLFVSSTRYIIYGLVGLLFAIGYSLPPFKLQARGFGEAIIFISWILVIVGLFTVSSGGSPFLAVQFGSSYALLVSALLLINQFPDFTADRQVGKNTIVVRLGLLSARYYYLLLLIMAHIWIMFLYLFFDYSPYILLALFSIFPAIYSIWQLWIYANTPEKLTNAIISCIVSVHLHGILLILSCYLS